MEDKFFMDPKEWGDGPWIGEPGMDAIVEEEYRGYVYHLQRNFAGAWCGYVAVDPSSPYAKEDYDDIDIEVHGGVTYGGLGKLTEARGSKEVYYIGFDCMHGQDLGPRQERINKYTDEDIAYYGVNEESKATLLKLRELHTMSKQLIYHQSRRYRTFEYATNECKSMIDQIIANPEMKQRTLIIIKPDAVASGHADEILKIIHRNGFECTKAYEYRISTNKLEILYEEYKNKPFFEELIDYMSSSPSIVSVYVKENAVEDFKKLKGATHPEKAAIGTLRHMFGTSVMKNAVHGSDTPEAAEREIELFFPRGNRDKQLKPYLRTEEDYK